MRIKRSFAYLVPLRFLSSESVFGGEIYSTKHAYASNLLNIKIILFFQFTNAVYYCIIALSIYYVAKKLQNIAIALICYTNMFLLTL